MIEIVRHCDWRDPAQGLAAFAAAYGPIDHALVDTPFSKHVHENCRSLRKAGGPEVDLGFEHLTDDERDQLCAVAGRVVRRWHLYHCDFESVESWKGAMEANGIEYVRCMVWVKVGAAPQITGDRPAAGAEAIVVGHTRKGNGKPSKKRWNAGGSHGVYRCAAPPAGRDRHPTQKPLELIEKLILDFTDHGDLLVDTHCGSGTTLVAAARRGRRAVGWEKSPKWARVARRRLATAHEQFDFTDAGQEQARQQMTLGG